MTEEPPAGVVNPTTEIAAFPSSLPPAEVVAAEVALLVVDDEVVARVEVVVPPLLPEAWPLLLDVSGVRWHVLTSCTSSCPLTLMGVSVTTQVCIIGPEGVSVL